MNMYRTGGDIGPNFNSVIGEAYAVVQYGDRPDPLSHPGCWAYPDMSEVGNFRGADPLRTDEERTHWGLWCILSSPLILGLDMSRGDTMDRVWPTITNPDALAVNDAWAGHPGTLIKSYVADGDDVSFTVDQRLAMAVRGAWDGGSRTGGCLPRALALCAWTFAADPPGRTPRGRAPALPRQRASAAAAAAASLPSARGCAAAGTSTPPRGCCAGGRRGQAP
ncbi:unnamed protein product [Prorocentrum cordatum]|uniref:Alpha-galactosidase n=1 Tax=Prorocentrum cordatum TaxID=2364126 RepID=A0ABN9YDR2_9DINO|nr:unnamed protein product [Polarella glacialis]